MAFRSMRFVLSVFVLLLTASDWTTNESPFYELYGEKLVAAGRYEKVIRYREHMLPLAEAIRATSGKRGTLGALRVLITNHFLRGRTGSELYVCELATSLLRLGHTPIVYSPQLGPSAQELRKSTVPVVDDLDAIASPPDVIHGQHHVETMTALLRFPNTPAIFFCHGWLPWEETPPKHPRILRYVAVDDTCRDRLVCESAVPEERVSVILNSVDVEQFLPRAPLPSKPARALVFSNRASESTHLGAVREACRRTGLSLDVIGVRLGQRFCTNRRTCWASTTSSSRRHDARSKRSRSGMRWCCATRWALVQW